LASNASVNTLDEITYDFYSWDNPRPFNLPSPSKLRATLGVHKYILIGLEECQLERK